MNTRPRQKFYILFAKRFVENKEINEEKLSWSNCETSYHNRIVDFVKVIATVSLKISMETLSGGDAGTENIFDI